MKVKETFEIAVKIQWPLHKYIQSKPVRPNLNKKINRLILQ